jgi:flagellar assembly protein FliH
MTNTSDESPETKPDKPEVRLAFPPPPQRPSTPPRPAFPPPPTPPVTPATRAFPLPPVSTLRFGEQVLRDERAGQAQAVRFDVDLRKRDVVPPELVEEVRAEAQAAGYAAGWAQGRREAQAAAQAQADRDALAVEEVMAAQSEQVDRAIRGIVRAADELERRAVPAITDIENTIAETALQVAAAVLAHEVRTATEPGRAALARALALAPERRPVVVRLNPADRMTIGLGDGVTEMVMDGRTVTLVDDPKMQPGDAVAICDATTIDARLGPALERVREVLGL